MQSPDADPMINVSVELQKACYHITVAISGGYDHSSTQDANEPLVIQMEGMYPSSRCTFHAV
jgi:selenophosphate synthetase-related protein